MAYYEITLGLSMQSPVYVSAHPVILKTVTNLEFDFTMCKYLSPADLACFEFENMNLDKLVSRIVSELQEPVLVLILEPITDDYSHKSYLVYRLYFRSHIDTHFTRVKLFRSLDEFCLWYVSSHPYRDFKLKPPGIIRYIIATRSRVIG